MNDFSSDPKQASNLFATTVKRRTEGEPTSDMLA